MFLWQGLPALPALAALAVRVMSGFGLRQCEHHHELHHELQQHEADRLLALRRSRHRLCLA